MPKYGRGLNREIVAAVNTGEIAEPFRTDDVKRLVEKRGWKTSINHINVTLANATSEEHSPTYKKYFVALGRGRYKLRADYRGNNWR